MRPLVTPLCLALAGCSPTLESAYDPVLPEDLGPIGPAAGPEFDAPPPSFGLATPDPVEPAPLEAPFQPVLAGGGQGATAGPIAVTASPAPGSACAGVVPLTGSASPTWMASPPRLDLANDTVARPAELLLVDGTGCLASLPFPDSESELLTTGFASVVQGDAIVAPAGLHLRLLDLDGELLLLQNANPWAWRADPATGSITRVTPFGRPVAGAASPDGSSAWVVLAEDTASPPQLLRADIEGGVLEGPFDLPLPAWSSGFLRTQPGGELVSVFRSHDVTIAADGVVWLLDSGTGALLGFDPATATWQSYPLAVPNPTALQWSGSDLLVVSGMLASVQGALLERPAVWVADPTSGATTLVGAITAPTGGWDASTGFASLVPGGRLVLQHAYDLEVVGGQLVLSDPANERVLAAP